MNGQSIPWLFESVLVSCKWMLTSEHIFLYILWGGVCDSHSEGLLPRVCTGNLRDSGLRKHNDHVPVHMISLSSQPLDLVNKAFFCVQSIQTSTGNGMLMKMAPADSVGFVFCCDPANPQGGPLHSKVSSSRDPDGGRRGQRP